MTPSSASSPSARPPGVFFTFQDAYSLSAKLDPLDGYGHVMAEDIAAALTENGWPCRTVPAWKAQRFDELFKIGRVPFVLNMNLIPDIEVTETSTGAATTFYNTWRKYFRLPVVAVLIDQGFHHWTRIRSHLPLGDDMALAVLEKSDEPFLRDAGAAPGRVVHLPWGGPPPEAKSKPFARRRYDLVFHGGMDMPKSEAEFRQQFLALGASDAIAQGAADAVAAVVEEGAGVEDAVRSRLSARGVDPGVFSILQRCKVLQLADRQARSIGRHRFLSAFADLPVDFFGDYPDAFRRGFPRARFHSGIPFRRIIDVMRDAKMSLCETIAWRENAHLRLTYAIPYGCLPVAEKNPRLARDFTDMQDIVFTSHPHADAADKVRALLADPKRGQAMIDAARPIYAARYAWRETVKVLAPFLPPPLPAGAGGGNPRKQKAKSAPKARSRRARRP